MMLVLACPMALETRATVLESPSAPPAYNIGAVQHTLPINMTPERSLKIKVLLPLGLYRTCKLRHS